MGTTRAGEEVRTHWEKFQFRESSKDRWWRWLHNTVNVLTSFFGGPFCPAVLG